MATCELKDVTGFILREFSYKETSKIIEVFTDKLGRISIMARGVYRKNSGLLSLTGRFMKVNLSLYKMKGDFYGIRDGYLVESYKKSAKNFDVILYKSAMCDFLLKTIDTSQKDTVFKLLDTSFRALEEADSGYLNIFLGFLIKYISFSGLKPNFSTCGICGRIIDKATGYFSIREASLICEEHKKDAGDVIYLTREDLLYFMKLLYTKSDELSELSPSPDYEKVARLIIDYCLISLDIKKFSSMDWVYKRLSERN